MLHIWDTGTSLIGRQPMAERFDEYVDQFTLGGGPFGITMNLRKSSATPPSAGTQPPAEDIGTIRMSLEHFKTMAFLMKRHTDRLEREMGVSIPLPVQLMNVLKIAPEDWDSFWKRVD